MIQEIPLHNIAPSPLNPRKSFGDLTDLANSIATHGVLQPVLVRPNQQPTDDSPNPYILIAGERRFRAAIQAQLTAIPANVLDLDETEALELTILENDQREDVHPMDQALGYEALLNRNRTIEQIAAKTGRTTNYVKNRLKLTTLIPEWREIVARRGATLDAALLIASLPHDAQNSLYEAWHWDNDLDKESRETPEFIVTPAWAQRQLRNTSLSNVPWGLDDTSLYPKAGACTTCPKSTLSQPDLWGETTGHCFDDDCRREKLNRFYTAKAKAEDLIPVNPNDASLDITRAKPKENIEQYTKGMATSGWMAGEIVYTRPRPTSDQANQEDPETRRLRLESEKAQREAEQQARQDRLARHKILGPLLRNTILDHVKAHPLALGDLAPIAPVILQQHGSHDSKPVFQLLGLEAPLKEDWQGKLKPDFSHRALAVLVKADPSLAPLAVAGWLLHRVAPFDAYNGDLNPLLTAWADHLNLDPESLMAEQEMQKSIKESKPTRKKAGSLPSGETPSPDPLS